MRDCYQGPSVAIHITNVDEIKIFHLSNYNRFIQGAGLYF